MKALLEFSLPEEANEHQDALQGAACKAILQDLDNHLRALVKYGDLPESLHNQAEEIRAKLHELADSSDVNIWG